MSIAHRTSFRLNLSSMVRYSSKAHTGSPMRVRRGVFMVIAAPCCFPILVNQQAFRLWHIERFERLERSAAMERFEPAAVFMTERFERSVAVERLERFERRADFRYLPSSMLTRWIALAISQPSCIASHPASVGFKCISIIEKNWDHFVFSSIRNVFWCAGRNERRRRNL